MGQVRAQVTTRSGVAGRKDAPVKVHGEWVLNGGRAPREMIVQLGELLNAARGVASDGLVTEVAVLVYPDTTVER